jgi:tetratricopeptide (TPR) repeat protein
MDHGADLVEALEYMPLAISQAGAYIQQLAPRTSISKYLEEFRRSERRKLSLLNRDKESLRRDRSASNSVIVTWQISFESIRSERPSAADLLSLMSFFDRQGIPDWLVRPPDNIVSHEGDADKGKGDVSDDSESEDDDNSDTSSASDASEDSAAQTFEDDLLMLRNYCLISLNKTGDIFEMHNLVQLAMRKWLSVDKRTETFKEQFIDRIARAFPTGEYSNWAKCEMLFAHVDRLVEHRPLGGKPLEEWAQALYNGSWYAQEQGRYSLAEVMAKKSRDARIEALGDEHQLTWYSVSMVAEVLRCQGKYKKAEKLFVEVMETFKQKLGHAHPDTLTSMANLASTYRKQGRWEEAEKLEVEVMETRKQKLGHAHPSTLTSMANLAITWYSQGRITDAINLMDLCIQTRRKVWVYVLRVELVDEDPPVRPPHLRRKQVAVGSDGEVALVRDQGSIGEQEAERTPPKSSAAAPTVVFLHVASGVDVVLGAVAIPGAREVLGPEAGLEQEARNRLEDSSGRPD